jgi:ribosomal protein L40E
MVRKIFPEATKRLYHRVFVCRKCKSKIRADYSNVREGKVKCRKCGSKLLRPKRKEKKV